MSNEKPQAGPNELVIGTAGKVLVSIHADGTLTYGDDYTPDEAAKAFWEAMASKRVDYETRLVFMAHVEQLLFRVGEQDLKVEELRTKAAQADANPVDKFQAERAVDQLQVQVHEIIELGRGIAYRNRYNRDEEVKSEMAPDKRFTN